MLEFLRKKKGTAAGVSTDIIDAGKGGGIIEAEVISREDVIVPPGEIKFTGKVVSVHEGYSFVGSVKRGYETIGTNGDVFVPQELPVGVMVEFMELNDDPKRPGKFRAENASVVDMALVESNQPRAIALRSLIQRSTYHNSAKSIDPVKAEKAAENEPFADMVINLKSAAVKADMGSDVTEAAAEFLRATFGGLASIGVSYSVRGDVDIAKEKKEVDTALKAYEQSGMEGQVGSVRDEYLRLTGVRNAFSMMHQNGLLTVESVVPIKYLPDLLVTAPVWFVHSRHGVANRAVENDPKPDHVVKFFSDQVGTKEFAWLYQIYNRRTRPIEMFSGRDIMPLPILRILEQAKPAFDYLVIATPYHDIASREWADPAWHRNIDPFLFGFYKDVPYMFLLGRWSGTGLFPLMCDMIADTIDHLRINREKLRGFSAPYWYKGDKPYDNGTWITNGERIEAFAGEVIRAYEQNRLFDFLRGVPAADTAMATR